MHVDRRETTSRGFRISYLVAGEGDPLLLLSGMGQHAQTWVEDGFVESLGSSFRLIIPDLLGVGASDQPTDPDAYTEPEVALDVLPVLDAEGITEPIRIWAYSRGVRLAFMLSLEAPERVARFVGGGSSVTIDPALVAGFHEALAPSMDAGDWDAYWEVFGIPMNDPAQRARFETTVNTDAAAAWLRGVAKSAYSYDLSKVNVPVLLYVGGDDMFASLAPDDAAALGCRLITLPGLDHSEAYLRKDLIEHEAVSFLKGP